MGKFFEYWKKGWKVWLMMLCINFSYVLLFLPAAIIVIKLAGRDAKGVYYLVAAILGLIFSPALTYLIFKSFYGER